ncbi:MAG: hypothetical protein ABL907_16330 [Hyphomicrobium sp.]
MTDYESRMIRGWRGRLEDMAVEIRSRIWDAPAQTVYIPGQAAPRHDTPYGYGRWFNREYGPERTAASADLKRIHHIKQKIGRDEQTEEQRERRRNQEREWYQLQRSRETAESRQKRLETQRAKRAKRTLDEIEREREWFRQWRARKSKSEEWRREQAEKKRLRRAAKPDLYDAIDRRSRERNRDAINERRRLAYQKNRDKHRAQK